MSWNSLGTVTITTDWQILEQSTLASTFRITYLGNIDQIWSYGRIRQYYSTNEVSPSIRIYPKSQSLILEIPIPQELINSGVAVRYLGVCKFPVYRNTIPDSDWQVLVEELI